MDPTLIMAGASILGKAMQTPPAYSGAQSGGTTEQIFDNSGWTVNFGDGVEQTTERTQEQAPPAGMNATLIILVVAGLVAWKIYAKTRK